MPDYSGQFSQVSGDLGVLRATLEALIREIGQARQIDRSRFEEIIGDLKEVLRHLDEHASASGQQIDGVDAATVESHKVLVELLKGQKILLDRRAFWQPIVHTVVKSLVPAGGLITILLGIWYLLQNLVELGAVIAGFR